MSGERIAAQQAEDIRRQEEDARRQEEDARRQARQPERPENCNSFEKNPFRCDNRKDYVKQTFFFHPDKNRGCQVEAAKKMEQLNELCNTVTGGRKQYKKKTRKCFKKNKKNKSTKRNLKYKRHK